MDIVERLRNQGDFWPKGLANEAVKEIKILRETLQKIADIELEDIPAPTSPKEAITWVTLERAVALAETALKGDK